MDTLYYLAKRSEECDKKELKIEKAKQFLRNGGMKLVVSCVLLRLEQMLQAAGAYSTGTNG